MNNHHTSTRVWDLPTRIFHWMLAFCVFGLLTTGFTGGDAMSWHYRFGYCVLTLLLFRLVWGIVGGKWSRFASFIYTPNNILRYLKGQGDPLHSVGHNPLGAFSVFAMLALLLVQVSTGLISDDEISAAGAFNQVCLERNGQFGFWLPCDDWQNSGDISNRHAYRGDFVLPL